jgi:hypothetical protein
VVLVKPSVGRVVHYKGWAGPCRAAIVTEVDEDPDKLGRMQPVSLVVFERNGFTTVHGVTYSEHSGSDTWHWPEREQ